MPAGRAAEYVPSLAYPKAAPELDLRGLAVDEALIVIGGNGSQTGAHALAQMVTKQSRKCLVGLGILTDEELESRHHVRLERYNKDILIELHTLREIVDTLVLPAAFSCSSGLLEAVSRAKSARMTAIPQVDAVNRLHKQVKELQTALDEAQTPEEREAFFEKLYSSPGFGSLI